MPEFKLNTPVVQNDPVVRVEVSATAQLPLGANRFRLVVVDDAGNESDPAFLDVVVRDMAKPTAVLDVVDANGRRVDAVVPFGSSFILSGGRSSDVAPGRVVEYRFTLVDRT
ncbi:MAG: hypothetical protein IT556_12260 [Acetobacteraceae bacterium]|nr:hypothetical protein [Acetobacteraceae bacterium]